MKKTAQAPGKLPPPPPPRASTGGKFEAKKYAGINGLSVEQVEDLKKSFDLFDTDGGGSISMKGNPT